MCGTKEFLSSTRKIPQYAIKYNFTFKSKLVSTFCGPYADAFCDTDSIIGGPENRK
jgi:hypothetical protein